MLLYPSKLLWSEYDYVSHLKLPYSTTSIDLLCSEISLWVGQHLVTNHELLNCGRSEEKEQMRDVDIISGCTLGEEDSRVHGTANVNNPHSRAPAQLGHHGSPARNNYE